MKCCRICGDENVGGDGENICRGCLDFNDLGSARENHDAATVAKAAKARAKRKAREDALRSCGLVKVRGALGGTYWE